MKMAAILSRCGSLGRGQECREDGGRQSSCRFLGNYIATDGRAFVWEFDRRIANPFD